MNKLARSIVPILFFLLVPALHAQSIAAEQIFAKMDEVAKTFRSAQANTERTYVAILVNDKDVSSGKFYYVRQGKEPRVRLDLLKPAVQQLVIDKGKLQLYTPSLKQVQEISLGQRQDVVELIMAMGFGQSSADLQRNFTISKAGDEVIDGKKTAFLDMKPKNSSLFQSVQMWMDPVKGVAVQIKTVEGSGNYLIVKFSDAKLNQRIDDSVFSLKLPKDVTVIKR